METQFQLPFATPQLPPFLLATYDDDEDWMENEENWDRPWDEEEESEDDDDWVEDDDEDDLDDTDDDDDDWEEPDNDEIEED